MDSHIIDTTPLYIEIETPDIRKRVFVSFDNDELNQEAGTVCNASTSTSTSHSIIIQDNWSFKCFIGYLISAFKIKSQPSQSFTLLTTDGISIKSLESIIPNQKLIFTTKKLDNILEYEQQQPNNTIIDSHSKIENTTLNIWHQQFNSNNEFINTFKKLQEKYQECVEIGESYPYCARVLIAERNERTGTSVWVYFSQDVTKESGFQVKVYCKVTKLQLTITDLSSKLKHVSQIESFIEMGFQQLKLFSSQYEGLNMYQAYLDQDVIDLFPKNYKVVTTIPFSQFYLECLKVEYDLVNQFKLSNSFIRRLIFESGINEKKIKNDIQQRVERYQFGRNDISQYKFRLSGTIECPICYDDVECETQLIQLECGHSFCTSCFRSYICGQVSSGNGNSIGIPCPDGCCSQFIDHVTIVHMLMLEYSGEKFNDVCGGLIQRLFDDLIQSTQSRKCRAKCCDRVLLKPVDLSNVIPYSPCSCNSTLCFNCGEGKLHWPAECSPLNEVVSPDDIESIRYIIFNTALCPTCKYPIERTIGCDHMHCTRCGCDFCYACGEARHFGYATCAGREKKKRLVADSIVKNEKLGFDGSQLLDLASGFQSREILGNINSAFQEFLMQNRFAKALVVAKAINKEFEVLLAPISKNRGLKKERKIELINSLAQLFKVFLDKSIHKRRPLKQTSPSTVEKALVCKVSPVGCSQTIEMFVKSNMLDFKNDIIQEFGKYNVDPQNIKFYTSTGSIIKSQYHIVSNEHICVSFNNEKWVDPTLIIDNINNSSANDIDNNKNKKKKRVLRKRQTKKNSNNPILNNQLSPKSAMEELIQLRTNPDPRNLTADVSSSDDEYDSSYYSSYSSGEEEVEEENEDGFVLVESEDKPTTQDPSFVPKSVVSDDDIAIMLALQEEYDLLDESKKQPTQFYSSSSLPCGLSSNHNILHDHIDDDFFERHTNTIERFETVKLQPMRNHKR